MIEPNPCMFTREKQLRRAMAGIRYVHDIIKLELAKIIKNKKTPGTEAPEVKLTTTQGGRREEC